MIADENEVAVDEPLQELIFTPVWVDDSLFTTDSMSPNGKPVIHLPRCFSRLTTQCSYWHNSKKSCNHRMYVFDKLWDATMAF